jgi:hypothetical protein
MANIGHKNKEEKMKKKTMILLGGVPVEATIENGKVKEIDLTFLLEREIARAA